MAKLKLFTMEVHYNPESLAKINDLKYVARLNGIIVTMDSWKEYAIKVSLTNGKTLVFKECYDGLYYLNKNDINKDVMADLRLKNIDKIKHISHTGKLQEQKNMNFYNSKLYDQVTLL